MRDGDIVYAEEKGLRLGISCLGMHLSDVESNEESWGRVESQDQVLLPCMDSGPFSMERFAIFERVGKNWYQELINSPLARRTQAESSEINSWLSGN